MTTEAPAKILDCTGLQCPMPVIKTSQAIKEVPVGQILELLATDPGVEPDMKAWTGRTGNELLEHPPGRRRLPRPDPTREVGAHVDG